MFYNAMLAVMSIGQPAHQAVDRAPSLHNLACKLIELPVEQQDSPAELMPMASLLNLIRVENQGLMMPMYQLQRCPSQNNQQL